MKKTFAFIFVLFFLVSCLPMDNSNKRPPRKNCSYNADCDPASFCTSNNFCAECEEDADCKDDNLYCSNYDCLIKGTPGSCLSHSDCTNTVATPKCNTATKTCVACLYAVSGHNTCPASKICNENNECVESGSTNPNPQTYPILGHTCTGSTSTCKYSSSDTNTFACKCASSWTSGQNRWVIANNYNCSRPTNASPDTKNNRYWCENNKYCTSQTAGVYKCVDNQCLSTTSNDCNFNANKTKCKTAVNPSVCVQCTKTSHCPTNYSCNDDDTCELNCVDGGAYCASGYCDQNTSQCTSGCVGGCNGACSDCNKECCCVNNACTCVEGHLCEASW